MAGDCLGWEPQQACLTAHVELARISAARGDRSRARELLDRLAGLWKDADPGLPLLRKARLLRSSLDK